MQCCCRLCQCCLTRLTCHSHAMYTHWQDWLLPAASCMLPSHHASKAYPSALQGVYTCSRIYNTALFTNTHRPGTILR